MFLVIPLVEFLHVLGVDIHVHQKNPTTFLGHVSVSSVTCSRHRFASSRWRPASHPEPRSDTRHPLGSHLSTRRHTKHHGEEMGSQKQVTSCRARHDASNACNAM